MNRVEEDRFVLEEIATKWLSPSGLEKSIGEFLTRLKKKKYRSLKADELEIALRITFRSMPAEDLETALNELEEATEPQFDGHLGERVLPGAESIDRLLRPLIEKELKRRDSHA